jgi:hypothetical protein
MLLKPPWYGSFSICVVASVASELHRKPSRVSQGAMVAGGSSKVRTAVPASIMRETTYPCITNSSTRSITFMAGLHKWGPGPSTLGGIDAGAKQRKIFGTKEFPAFVHIGPFGMLAAHNRLSAAI